jgi:glutamate synthase (NADPH/NADH) small chain
MGLGEPDDSGRRRPLPKAGSEHTLRLDTVIMAIGTKPNPTIASSTPGLEVNQWGYIQVDKETMETTRKGVYAGGDIAGMGANVIWAMGEGRRAAEAMHEYLNGHREV